MRRFISWGLGITTLGAGGIATGAWAAVTFPDRAERIASLHLTVFGLAGLLLIATTFPYWRVPTRLDRRIDELKEAPKS